ncbi:MAG: hypothetical protein ACYDGY_03610 [Acidimicrobiales bacterium]
MASSAPPAIYRTVEPFGLFVRLLYLSPERWRTLLAVSVDETQPPTSPRVQKESGIALAWHHALGGFMSGFYGLIGIAGPLLFALVCLILLALIIRYAWRAAHRWLL